MKTLLIYCRVSTEEQAKKGLSLNDQEKRGIELSQRLQLKYEVYKDEAVSGTTRLSERNGMSLLLERILDDDIKAVFVTDIDRIARNTVESLSFYALLQENKVSLFDVNGRAQLEDENQELLINIKSLFASFEIKKTSGRIKRVLERNVKEGKVTGGPLQPYGYSKDPNKKLIINDVESDIVKLIYQMSLQGKGTKVIANILNEAEVPTKRDNSEKGQMKVRGVVKEKFVWRDSVIYRMLTNPMYMGKRRYKNKLYDCPSIIEPETFNVIQEQLKSRKHFKDTNNKYFYLLKGLLKCSCGRNFYGRKRADLSDNQYICASQRYPGEFCGTRGLNITFLENLIWFEVINLPKQLESYFKWFDNENILEESTKKLKYYRDKLADVNKRKQKLWELFETDSIPKEDLSERLIQINLAAKYIEGQIDTYDVHSTFKTDRELIIKHVNNNLDFVKNLMTNESKERVVRALISKINIVWVEEDKRHIISVNFNIGKMTQVLMGRTVEVEKRSKVEKVISRELTTTTNIIAENDDLFQTKRFSTVDRVVDWESEKKHLYNTDPERFKLPK